MISQIVRTSAIEQETLRQPPRSDGWLVVVTASATNPVSDTGAWSGASVGSATENLYGTDSGNAVFADSGSGHEWLRAEEYFPGTAAAVATALECITAHEVGQVTGLSVLAGRESLASLDEAFAIERMIGSSLEGPNVRQPIYYIAHHAVIVAGTAAQWARAAGGVQQHVHLAGPVSHSVSPN